MKGEGGRMRGERRAGGEREGFPGMIFTMSSFRASSCASFPPNWLRCVGETRYTKQVNLRLHGHTPGWFVAHRGEGERTEETEERREKRKKLGT